MGSNQSYIAKKLHLFAPPNDVSVVFVPDAKLDPGEVRVRSLSLLSRLLRGARVSCKLEGECVVLRVTLRGRKPPLATFGESRTYFADDGKPARYQAIPAGDAVSKLVVAFGPGPYEYRIN